MTNEERTARIDAIIRPAVEGYEKALRPLFESVFQAIEAVESAPIQYRFAAFELLTDLRRTVLEKSTVGDLPGIKTALLEHLAKFNAMLGN